MIFASTLTSLHRQFQERYTQSSSIRHRGERGRQREFELSEFLSNFLPEAYGVATGEVVPFRGANSSPQCDIIIYDKLRMLIVGRGKAVQQIPIEAVYAMIECKSVLDATAVKDAARKFSEIRKLPRARSKLPCAKGCRRGPAFLLFGYHFATTEETLLDFMRHRNRRRNTFAVALNKGCGVWVIGHPKPIWVPTFSQEHDSYDSIAWFYVLLLEGLRDIDLGNPSFFQMILL